MTDTPSGENTSSVTLHQVSQSTCSSLLAKYLKLAGRPPRRYYDFSPSRVSYDSEVLLSTVPQSQRDVSRIRRCGQCCCNVRLFGSLRWLIHSAVGFTARVKECYVTPLEHVRTCFYVRCEIRRQLIVAYVHTRNSKQLVDHRAWQADSRMRPHQEQRTAGGSQSAAS